MKFWHQILRWNKLSNSECLYNTLFLNIFSLHRIRLFGPIHVRNGYENVCTGSTYLLWIELQSFWLRRHIGLDIRGDLVSSQIRFVWFFRPSCSSSTQDIQSYQILVEFKKSRHFAAQLDAQHHIPSIPALPLHSHICPSRHAAIRWSVQFWHWYSTD